MRDWDQEERAMANMFDKYFICDETFCNLEEDGKITGFQIGIKVSYYRGVNLAIVDDYEVEVDGQRYPKEQIHFTLRDIPYTYEEMRGRTDVHWDFGEIAYLRVEKEGGLPDGQHTVKVHEAVRIVNGMNIPPVMFCANWEKKLMLMPPVKVPPRIRRGVSFYSYQDEYYLGKLDAEGCIRAVSELGAKGVEIISEAIIPNFPNPPQSWVDQWFTWMEKYGTEPVCYDMFMDGQIIDGIDISEGQAVEIMETNIRLAARLGFRFLRVVYTIPLNIIEKALPCAEQYNVVMGLEIHPPFQLGTEWVDRYIDFIKRTGTKYFSIIPDFGIFMEKPVPAREKKALKHGATPEIVAYIHEAYSSRMTYEQAMEKIRTMNPNDVDLEWAKEAFSCTYCDPELIGDYIPYISHIHAKVYDMDLERQIDPSVDNETIFRVLKEKGWSGYVCTEYEGQRIFHDEADMDVDNMAVIRAHHEMMKRYIGE